MYFNKLIKLATTKIVFNTSEELTESSICASYIIINAMFIASTIDNQLPLIIRRKYYWM
jgi:hypothetical protein